MNLESENLNLKKRISIPLLTWGGINIFIGIFYFYSTIDILRGLLLQAFFWGAIDGIIGLISYLGKKELDLGKIKKILLINVYLDILYIIIGLFLILFGTSAFIMGNGYGVIIQGVFLLIADLVHHNYIKKNLTS